uniref:Eukaryotic initiation factor 4E n=1 Tax=viral metagenome TaxID=1070528 RepID=A0A6C0JX61_9ZZZZ
MEITHTLHDTWVLWTHLPHEQDWRKESYKEIMSFHTVEEAIGLLDAIPPDMLINCMIFIMRQGITPLWEDSKNINGGCFSYKIDNRSIPTVWKDLMYSLIGETLSNNESVQESITGITVSPKKRFCIVKIWLSTCNYQTPSMIHDIFPNMTAQGGIFKRHG